MMKKYIVMANIHFYLFFQIHLHSHITTHQWNIGGPLTDICKEAEKGRRGTFICSTGKINQFVGRSSVTPMCCFGIQLSNTLKSFKEPSPSTLSQRQLPRTLNLDYRHFLSCSSQMALMGCPLDALMIRVNCNLKKLTQYNNCSINQKS